MTELNREPTPYQTGIKELKQLLDNVQSKFERLNELEDERERR